jgi:hypothetical protein
LFRGYIIDRNVRKVVKETPDLKHLETKPNRGIDFTDPNTGERYEISTWAQLINKINKYIGNFVFVATD